MRDKCNAIQNMKAPKSVKECRTFCGMVNFLSTFCKNLRQLLIPIYELTKKHAHFAWIDRHQKAFEEFALNLTCKTTSITNGQRERIFQTRE